jgi:hypothetical protein
MTQTAQTRPTQLVGGEASRPIRERPDYFAKRDKGKPRRSRAKRSDTPLSEARSRFNDLQQEKILAYITKVGLPFKKVPANEKIISFIMLLLWEFSEIYHSKVMSQRKVGYKILCSNEQIQYYYNVSDGSITDMVRAIRTYYPYLIEFKTQWDWKYRRQRIALPGKEGKELIKSMFHLRTVEVEESRFVELEQKNESMETLVHDRDEPIQLYAGLVSEIIAEIQAVLPEINGTPYSRELRLIIYDSLETQSLTQQDVINLTWLIAFHHNEFSIRGYNNLGEQDLICCDLRKTWGLVNYFKNLPMFRFEVNNLFRNQRELIKKLTKKIDRWKLVLTERDITGVLNYLNESYQYDESTGKVWLLRWKSSRERLKNKLLRNAEMILG